MQERRCLGCGGNILNNYSVKLYPRAYRDMDKIYAYIAYNLLEPGVAANLVNGDYRQLLKNYVIIYRVLHEQREVHVVTVRYAASEF